jgi:glycosyltransferase involved in cell wall biosynthesis
MQAITLPDAADTSVALSDRPISILHVINHSRRANGHVCAMVDLACGQAMRGHKVTICSAGGDFDAIFESHGIQHVKIDQQRKPLQLLIALQKLLLLLQRTKPDIVHAHMVTSALLVWPWVSLLRLKLVTSVHNEFEKSAILMRAGHRVIGVSQFVSRSMIARGIPARKVRTVLNGTIGTPRFPPAPAEPVTLRRPAIAYVGGLHARKGVADLIAAHAVVLETYPEAYLYLIGAGPCREDYEAQANACAPERVVFCGYSHDPRRFLQNADIFVLPSHNEPAGLVISEARECGCAIIASNVGGIPEMLDEGRAGTLVPPRRPDLLAAAITALLREPSMLAAARSKSQVNLGHLSLARVTGETLSVYAELLPR